MDFSKAIEIIKLKPKYLFPIVIFTGIIVFSKDKFLNYLGTQEFVNQYRAWFGITFLASCALLVSHGTIKIGTSLIEKFSKRQTIKLGQKLLHSLTPAEIGIISYYIINNTRTQSLNVADGVAMGLEQKYIIYRAAEIGSTSIKLATLGDILFDFNIQPWAWRYLNKHKELLGLIQGKK